MTVRFYILPMETVVIGYNDKGEARYGRGPKYLPWRFDPDPVAGLAGVWWNLKDFGAIDTCMVAADVTTAQHNGLAAQGDVIALPANLDEAVGAARLNATVNAIESLRIPGDWVRETHTYRELARYVCGLFLYAQRVTGKTDAPLMALENNLTTRFRDLPQRVQAAMADSANELGYYTGDITANNTLRVILKKLADEWRGPIKFGKRATL